MDNQTSQFLTTSTGTTSGFLSIGSNNWNQAGISATPNYYWGNNGKVSIITKIKLFGLKIWTNYKEISVQEFFERAKFSKKQIEVFDKVIDRYSDQITKAKELGQIALVEKMQDSIEVIKKEAVCAVFGITEYLEKEQLDKLLKISSKHIKLTDVKNYTRIIPDKIATKLKKLVKNSVFDRYVIAHYDPKKEAVEMTKKEIEKAKDPILFGVLNGSTNFYFIGDWIDEHCNLTLKEAIKIIDDKTKNLIK